MSIQPDSPRPLHFIRRDYGDRPFGRVSAADDPFIQFDRWFAEASAAGIVEPNAMTLATSDIDGRPDARIVLLKNVSSAGLVFFTNYESPKGVQLSQCPHVALLFYWDLIERQVRIRGQAKRLTDEESDAYFATRPRSSQLAAIASPQSRVLPDRATLEADFAATEVELAAATPQRPAHWGGYLVQPDAFEFWQGRASRLHDRLRYRRSDSGWQIERLAP